MKKRLIFFPLLLLCSVLSCSTTSFEHVVKEPYLAKEEDGERVVDNKLVIKHMYFDEPGDCTLIQFGGKNILIDTGPAISKDSALSSGTFNNRLAEFGVKEKDKLDYVIITHQDDDHTGNCEYVFNHPIGTLIDFDTSQDLTIDEEVRNTFYKSYNQPAYDYFRDRLSNGKKIDLYVPSTLCFYKKRNISSSDAADALTSANINALGKSIGDQECINSFINSPDVFTIKNEKDVLTIKILYNKHSIVPLKTGSVLRNCMSVCTLLEYKNEKYLFTGDLMEFETTNYSRVYGETDLVRCNYDDLKSGVLYFRGGHHGSNSSSSEYFLSVIRPQYVFWTSGGQYSGRKHYDFPRSAALIRVGKYTDKVFVSSIDTKILDEKNESDKDVSKLHGKTTFIYDPDNTKNKVTVEYENSNPNLSTYEPDSIFLTSLFKKLDYRDTVSKSNDENSAIHRDEYAAREYPVYAYNLTTSTNRPDKPVDCTYIKFGHLDIIIGAGSSSRTESKTEIVNKIKYLCNDKTIDYLVIPTSKFDSYSFLLDSDGLFAQKDLTFKNVIYRDVDSGVFTKEFDDALAGLDASSKIKVSQISGRKITLDLCSDKETNENSNLYLHFLKTRKEAVVRPSDYNNWQSYSICTLFTAGNFSYLNLGSDYTYGYDVESSNPIEDNYLLKNNASLLNNKVDVLQMPYYGSLMKSDHVSLFYDFVSKISNDDEYNNYADNGGKFVVLANTTMYYKKDENNVVTYKYPANLASPKTDDNGEYIGKGLKYKKNGEERSLLLFVTEKTVDESKTAPFATASRNADLCLRVTIQQRATLKRKHYQKVTYGVNRNFSPYLGKLLFANIFEEVEAENEEESRITGNHAQENRNYGFIRDREGFYDIRVKDEDFVVNN